MSASTEEEIEINIRQLEELTREVMVVGLSANQAKEFSGFAQAIPDMRANLESAVDTGVGDSSFVVYIRKSDLAAYKIDVNSLDFKNWLQKAGEGMVMNLKDILESEVLQSEDSQDIVLNIDIKKFVAYVQSIKKFNKNPNIQNKMI